MAPTIVLDEAVKRPWDALIIGAGPAGSMAARELARRGRRVLLIDKSLFPRSKVCGSCLSGLALETLKHAGLEALPEDLSAVPLKSVRLSHRGKHASLRLPAGRAVTREHFDEALLREAIASGADFLPPSRVMAIHDRSVEVQHTARRVQIEAKIIIIAAGLGSVLPAGVESRVVPASRIGAGAIIDSDEFEPGVVHMMCGRAGYVGAVVVEDGRVDLAAALDPQAVREQGIGTLIRGIVAEAGGPDVESLNWRGTPPLTRRTSAIAGPGWFALGDAARYVEPFTGEGIGWALRAAVALAPLADRAIAGEAVDWPGLYRRLLRGRQRNCRLMARSLRSPFVMSCLMAGLRVAPWLANPFVNRLNRERTWA